MQAWGFANIGYEPGEDFWQQVGQNAIYHIHDYSAQNIANGESGWLILLEILAVVFACLPALCVLDTGSGAASAVEVAVGRCPRKHPMRCSAVELRQAGAQA